MKVILATDKNFLEGLRIAIISMLHATAAANELTFAVLHSSLSASEIESLIRLWERHSLDRSRISFVNIDSHDFSGVRMIRGSKMTYARMLIPELFPDESEVIYCDCDILLRKGLDEVLEAPTSNQFVAGAQDATVLVVDNDCAWNDVPADGRQNIYFNCGLIKINLELWREHDISKRAIHISRSEPEKCKYWDQSVLNYLCIGRSHIFDQSNNLQLRADSPPQDSLDVNIHYIGPKKPWMLYVSNESFRLWRQSYADNVSRIPYYALRPSFLFLSAAVWVSKVTGSRDKVRAIRRALLGW